MMAGGQVMEWARLLGSEMVDVRQEPTLRRKSADT